MVLESYPDLRYCRIKKGEKKPFETAWQKKGYTFEEIVNFLPNENYGVLCGYGNLIVIDSDTPELQSEVETLLPDTFRVRTGSGGTHNYFFCPEHLDKIVLSQGSKHFGEVQGIGSQVVGSGSVHPNGRQYEKINENSIASITKSELFSLVDKFRDKDSFSFQSESEEDFKEFISKVIPMWKEGNRNELCLSVAGYLRKEKRLGINKVKNIISEICKHSKDTELQMRFKTIEATFEKNEAEIKGFTGLKDIVPELLKEEKPQYKNHLEVLTYLDLKKFKADKNFLIEGFLYPGSVNMVYSPPAQFKSLLAVGMGFALSNGHNFLGMKTKKAGVLYLDGENSQKIMKERAEQIHKGMGLKRNKFPLYFLKGGLLMDAKKNINLPFLVEIEALIKKENIKVLFFDTLHRFCLYDENSADDLSKLYTEVFKPLADTLGVAIVFLHHSTKSGGYRGSGDFLGMVDVSYRVERREKTGEFKIINEKSRSGEIPEIKGEIYFGENTIRFNRLETSEEDSPKLNKLVDVTNQVQSLFDETSRLSRVEIISFLDMQKYDYGSTRTIDRALKFLVEKKKILDKTSKGVYSLI